VRRCAASVRELQDLPQALALVSRQQLEDDRRPASLLPSLQRRVRSDRNRDAGSSAAWRGRGRVHRRGAVVATRPDSPSSHPVAMQAVGAGTAIRQRSTCAAWRGAPDDLVCI